MNPPAIKILKFGLIPELVGRLPVIATLEDLDETALVDILTKPKNALIKQFQKLFEMEDVRLTSSQDALGEIVRKAITRKAGARGLRSILEDILLDSMFEHLLHWVKVPTHIDKTDWFGVIPNLTTDQHFKKLFVGANSSG